MSARKFVRQQVTSTWPTPTDGQFIAKVKGARGNNLHAIETEEGEEMLVSMPTRFRNNVWMKRGDYIIADPIDEGQHLTPSLYSSAICYRVLDCTLPTWVPPTRPIH